MVKKTGKALFLLLAILEADPAQKFTNASRK